MRNISVISVVYNEENRIETFLKSMAWSNDIIIVDKSSTDNTREIALKYTPNVFTVPYTDAGDVGRLAIEKTKNEWILTLTASDIIHPELVKELLYLINQDKFDYDIIALPFDIYIFGIMSDRSPWCTKEKGWMFRKSVLVLKDEVHDEINFTSNKVYKVKYKEDIVLSHLTHANMDTFMERHIRYARSETKKYLNEKESLRKNFRDIFYSIYYVFIKKKSFLLGWDGIALGLAYISYFILTFLFVWEKFRGDGDEKYKEIRNRIIDEWEKS